MKTKKRAKTTSPTATATKAVHPLADQLIADAESAVPSPDTLARITDAAAEMRRYAEEALRLEEEAKQAQAESRRLAEQVLPQLMDEAGVPFLGLEDGSKLERIEAVYASISKANAVKAAQWLEEHGYGALIKNGFSISVDKGDVVMAAKVREALIAAGLSFEEQSGIHPQTLVAFVKESLAEGRELPKAITYHVQPKVVIKQPKKATQKAKRNSF